VFIVCIYVMRCDLDGVWYGIKLQKSALRKAFRWASNVYGWEWYRNVAGDLLN
jgi:hypothetical protein